VTWQEQKNKICELNSRCIEQVERWVNDELTNERKMALKSVVDRESGYKEPSLQDAVDLLAKCSTIAKQWIEVDKTKQDELSDSQLARQARK